MVQVTGCNDVSPHKSISHRCQVGRRTGGAGHPNHSCTAIEWAVLGGWGCHCSSQSFSVLPRKTRLRKINSGGERMSKAGANEKLKQRSFQWRACSAEGAL